jgi:hypothetical protein
MLRINNSSLFYLQELVQEAPAKVSPEQSPAASWPEKGEIVFESVSFR